jgi:hypothetical protein
LHKRTIEHDIQIARDIKPEIRKELYETLEEDAKKGIENRKFNDLSSNST